MCGMVWRSIGLDTEPADNATGTSSRHHASRPATMAYVAHGDDDEHDRFLRGPMRRHDRPWSYTPRMTVDRFTPRFLAALEELGQPADRTHRTNDEVPNWVPLALRELYLVAGNHPLNRAHNRLLPPDELKPDDGRVVFAEENQQVVVWAFETVDTAADPMVWQGQPDDAAGFVWYSEDRTLSEFIISMWNWIVTGDL